MPATTNAAKKAVPSMLARVSALDNFTESINMLVYADPGVGKTVLAGTVGERGLIVAIEPGTVSAARAGSKAQYVRPKSWAEFKKLLDELRALPAKDFPFDWIAIDTLTELHSLAWNGILQGAGGPENDNARIQDYGTIQSLYKRIVRALNDLPCNVLYLCHAMKEEDEDGNPVVLPDIPGKWGTNDPTTASRWTCGTVHVYGFMKVVTIEEEATGKKKSFRRIMVRRKGAYFGKDRYNVFGPYIDRPNMLTITKQILESAQPKG